MSAESNKIFAALQLQNQLLATIWQEHALTREIVIFLAVQSAESLPAESRLRLADVVARAQTNCERNEAIIAQLLGNNNPG